MNRRFLVILLSIVCIFCLAFGLTACADGDGGEQGGEQNGTEQGGEQDGDGGEQDGEQDGEQGNTNPPDNDEEDPPAPCEHNYSDWQIVVEPTCTADGSIRRECAVCGDVEYNTVAATGHNPSDTWVPDENAHKIVCQTCGQTLEEQDHVYNGLSCEVCGYPRYSQGLEYSISNDEVTITGIGTCSDALLMIPATIGGQPVVAIGDKAFSECKIFESVVIPDGVISIGEEAFANCSNLTTVTFGENSRLTSVNYGAFSLCSNLARVTFANNGNLTSIGRYVFAFCIGLKSITIPDSVTSIGAQAFYYCYSLTNVVFGDDSQLAAISTEAFAFCMNLQSITIPKGVTYIGGGAFAYCLSLTSVIFKNVSGWEFGGASIPSSDLANPEQAAIYLTDERYFDYAWMRS